MSYSGYEPEVPDFYWLKYGPGKSGIYLAQAPFPGEDALQVHVLSHLSEGGKPWLRVLSICMREHLPQDIYLAVQLGARIFPATEEGGGTNPAVDVDIRDKRNRGFRFFMREDLLPSYLAALRLHGAL